MAAKIAVIGAGWWAQGWHIPCLDRNPDADLVAVVDQSEQPQSDMDPNLVSLKDLKERYNTRVYLSLQTMLEELKDQLDGVIISTPHSTHYQIGQAIYAAQEQKQRQSQIDKPIHILMEKPMTTDVEQALLLCDLVQKHPDVSLWINHSANFRPQAVAAREILSSEKLGTIRHINCSMASPVQWVFQNPRNSAWTRPSGTMLGNGFAWGQSCHLIGWIYFVCGDQTLNPSQVFCAMNHDPITGADMSHSATVLCENEIVMNVSGTAYLPGSQYSEKRIGKQIRIQIFGTQGALFYEGDDSDPSSGVLEFRKQDGTSEVICETFLFESADVSGYGAESVANFVQMCCCNHDPNRDRPLNCAPASVGLKTVRTLEAMYRSHAEKALVNVR